MGLMACRARIENRANFKITHLRNLINYLFVYIQQTMANLFVLLVLAFCHPVI